MSLPISKAVSLIQIEREKRARAAHRSKKELRKVILQARLGDVRPYVELQWPGIRLDEWQWDILESLFNPSIRRVFVKGNTGCGKGAAAGIACCMYYHIWDDAKVVITRDSEKMAVKLAFGEVDKWWRKMQYPPEGDLLSQTVYGSKQHMISVANPKHPEGFRGAHSEHVLFWFDEATAPNLEDKYTLANTQAKKFLALSNPSTLAGEFRSAFPASNPDVTQTIVDQYGQTRCITVSGWDCTNVKMKCLQHPVAPIGGIEINGRQYQHGDSIPPEDYQKCLPVVPGQTCLDEFLSLFHSSDPLIKNVYALGKFPDEDPEKQIVLYSWTTEPRFSNSMGQHPLMRMIHEWSTLSPVALHDKLHKLFADEPEAFNLLFPIQAMGLDVAASKHGDTTVLAVGGDYGVRGIHECQFSDTQQTIKWVLDIAEEKYGINLKDGSVPIGIDWGGGYGNAVGDPMDQQGVSVVKIHGSATSDVDSQLYANKRAELYGEVGRWLDPLGDFRMMNHLLPNNTRMIQELTAPQKIYAGRDSMKFYITPKDRRGADENYEGKTLKELLKRSPDRADAVVYMFDALRRGGRRRLLVA